MFRTKTAMQIPIILLIALCVVGKVLADCPPGYEAHGDFCYKLLQVKASYGEAQHYCEIVGGNLVVINDKAENDFIVSYLNRIHASIQTSQIWIGGIDLLQEGTFVVPKTLEVLPYLNWGPGEPDNSGGQHCLALFGTAPFGWDDSWCDHAFNPLCKRPLSESEIVG